MTAATAAASVRRPLGRATAAACGAGIAVACGLAAGIDPALGVLAALAVVYALVVARDVALGLCAFLVVTFLDVVSAGSDVSLTKAAGAVLVVGWLAAAGTGTVARRPPVPRAGALATVAVAFVAWSALSAVWAQSPAAALSSTTRYGLDALLIPIAVAAVRGERHVRWIFAVFVAGALASVAWGMTHDPSAGVAAARQAGRLTGARAEANVLATLLVLSFVFAASLAMVLRGRGAGATLALGAAVCSVLALAATYSRGGLVAFAVAVLVGVLFGGRWRPALVAVSVVAALAGGLSLAGAPDATLARLTSGDTSGRADIWRVAGRMVAAHPLGGVGSGNFQAAEVHYLVVPGTIRRDEYILDTPLVAHNMYLHVLAEMGVVGLALFLAVLGIAFGSAVKAARLFVRQGRGGLELLARALVMALAGSLAADVFVSEQYDKQLWILLGLGPALLALATRAPSPARRARSGG